MKSIYNFKKGESQTRSSRLTLKYVLGIVLILTVIQVQANAQGVEYSQPLWWFGVAGGANLNFYRGSTQTMEPGVIAPLPFTSGFGVGLYAAPLVEFHPADSRWGFMLQAGYDNRSGVYKEVLAPCNCPRDLSTNISYVTVEPSLRFEPFKSNFYVFGGPRIAFNVEHSYVYTQKNNPASADQTPIPDEKGNLSDMNKTQISMQVGAGYDIQLSSIHKKTKFVLSPFVSFQPYFGQSPRSIETWNVTTLRAGLALKLGCGHFGPATVPALESKRAPVPAPVEDRKVQFFVNVPPNIPTERKVREAFPLRNDVFFNTGSTEIPNRYVLLSKDQAQDFKEDHAELFTPKNPSSRSPKQMTVYYNILNILGYRMSQNPSSTIMLIGSSETSTKDGKEMAESIKHYLVTIFGIKPSRIRTNGQDKPNDPSEQPGGTKDLALLREGDRKVSIESIDPALLMEFQSGPGAPLKPVEVTDVDQAPVESYITFNAGQGDDSFSSWTLQTSDEKGHEKYFGTYSQEKVSIPGKNILGDRPNGDYKITITGKTKSGKEVKYDTTVHLTLWTPPVNQEVTRFSIIYEFNNSKAISIYKKYLDQVVIPKIPASGRIIIHGYTDIIGDPAYNQKLSLARANDVKEIMESSLKKAKRSDVKFEIFGFGADQSLAQFKNDFPEERSYNRTVLIDILPPR